MQYLLIIILGRKLETIDCRLRFSQSRVTTKRRRLSSWSLYPYHVFRHFHSHYRFLSGKYKWVSLHNLLILRSYRFDPEMLGYIYSKSMFIWLFETTIQKGLFYFLNFGNPSFFELLCYTGYKFVNLSIIIVVQLSLGYIASYVAFFLTSLMYFVFFYKTMSRFFSGNTLADHIGSSFNKKTFFLVNSIVQVVLIWILSLNWIK